MFGKRILILVPHPDDEIVACAAAIGRARKSGAQIFALYLTHGCIARHTMWPWQRKHYDAIVARRRAEAEQAAHHLGITPVGWSDRPARALSTLMNFITNEIRQTIKTYDIDQLWLPAYEGGNPDHDVLNAIGQGFKSQIGVLEFAEYNFANGKPNSQTFPFPNGNEQIIELTEQERAHKQTGLEIYQSEKSNIDYVRTERETFRPLAYYDYTHPPHPGKLWYARFQWVPFRHPRVDFTNPAEISKSIEAFLKED